NVVQHTVDQNNVGCISKRIKRPILDASGKEICRSTSLKLDPCGLDVSVPDIKSPIFHPSQTSSNLSRTTPHIDKFLIVAPAKNVPDTPLLVRFASDKHVKQAVHPRNGKNRPQSGIDLHLRWSKDFARLKGGVNMCKVFPQAQFFSRDKYWRGGAPVLLPGESEGPPPPPRSHPLRSTVAALGGGGVAARSPSSPLRAVPAPPRPNGAEDDKC